MRRARTVSGAIASPIARALLVLFRLDQLPLSPLPFCGRQRPVLGFVAVLGERHDEPVKLDNLDLLGSPSFFDY